MRIKFISIQFVLFLSLLACKDKPTSNSQKQSSEISAASMVVCTQDYNLLLGNIELNDSMLKVKGVKSYSASQTQRKGAHKLYYTNLNPSENAIRFCELMGRDTLIREKLISQYNGVTHIEKLWKAINRKVMIYEFLKNELSYSVVNEKGKSDTTITKPNYFIEYSNGDRLTYSYRVKGIVEVTHRKADGSIRFQYEDELNKGLPTKRTYLVGSKHIYIFFYDTKNQLTKVVWKESKEVHNATISFEYDSDGLMIKRTIESEIPAFGHSTTTYSYQK